MYFNVVVPLREAYPLAVDIDDEEGRSGHDMLTALKQHLQKGSSGPQVFMKVVSYMSRN